MDYNLNVCQNLTSHEDIELQSISGRADIVLHKIDQAGYHLTCADGKHFTEPHSRVEKVFQKLLENGVIHVDAALENSGTRRNIPETLLANLPFVEHGKIEHRKHLYLQDGHTHDKWTLKCAD
ncbi:hypothetical protein [Shewanella atlantica]|uniref:Uncharacterized protein n=1 Tax=Shewanella atlantica TaxID=271099 RepID=A0A431W8I6_9GAMM|nr:hypothetical protein [Shewanella atlantica]RTR31654.1 hypothetical protein EKG39_13140 [Shewanella atlantica]